MYKLEVKTVTIERTNLKRKLYLLIGLDGMPIKILEESPMDLPYSLEASTISWCEKYVRNLNVKLKSQQKRNRESFYLEQPNTSGGILNDFS